VPNNLCGWHDPDAIYIYGVSQEQLAKIKEVYYPNDPRPLIAKDFGAQPEQRWITNYSSILEQICQEFPSQPEFILPTFNLRVHQFDADNNRKARRFKEEEIKEKLENYTKADSKHSIERQ
jgi:hypothetical protein